MLLIGCTGMLTVSHGEQEHLPLLLIGSISWCLQCACDTPILLLCNPTIAPSVGLSSAVQGAPFHPTRLYQSPCTSGAKPLTLFVLVFFFAGPFVRLALTLVQSPRRVRRQSSSQTWRKWGSECPRVPRHLARDTRYGYGFDRLLTV